MQLQTHTACLFALTALVTGAQDLQLGDEEEPVVELEVLADVSHATPGAHFQLAVRFELPEHWHIYWENQGDTGLPTKLTVEGPEGFEVGATLYPGPKRLPVVGGIVSYGYEEEVCLLVPVTVPLDAQVGSTATFTIRGQWLLCRVPCFRQSAELELSLPVATRVEDQVPRPTHLDVFKYWRTRLPRPQAEIAGLSYTWSETTTSAPVLELNVADCDAIEFFPGRTDTLLLTSALELAAPDLPAGENPGPGTRLEFDTRVYGDEVLANAVRGILRIQRGNDVRFYHLAVPRPGA